MQLTPIGIRELRYIVGWSTARMGAAVGVSARTVEGWEKGIHYPCKRAQKMLHKIVENGGLQTERIGK